MIKLVTGILLITLAVLGCADIGALDPGYNVVPVYVPGKAGTAFAVGEHHWITANHVVDGDRAQIETADGWVDAIVVSRDRARDQATLYAADFVVEEPLDTCHAQWGEHICGCGYELDDTLICECGTILKKDGPRFIAGVSSHHGWSGGPLINGDDCVVGVISKGTGKSLTWAWEVRQ